MKLNVFKKVCLTMMGVGVVSSLVSVGTFATFTATTTNPGNTFAAGTLKITTATGSGSAGVASGLGSANLANLSFTSGGACTNVVASACGTLVATSSVAATGANGLEGFGAGQWAKGQITITNSGTLPAFMTVLATNVSNLAATTGCPSDIGSAPSSTACTVLGDGLNVTLGDAAQCIYGNGTLTGAVANTAPNADSVAVGSPLCTDISGAADLQPGTTASPANPFTVSGANGFKGKLTSPVYVQGSTTTNGTKVVGGTTVKAWAPGESHTFTLAMALPDQGTTTGTIGSDTVTIGRDNKFMGGSVSFDLVWLAQQG